MLIDHISLAVSDLARSERFYRAALDPLGVSVHAHTDDSVTFARQRFDDFSIHPAHPAQLPLRPPVQSHFAFSAPSREAVDRFHAAALQEGGKDDGPPGLRPEYHANYYAAFVIDPDGYRIEAVCHEPA